MTNVGREPQGLVVVSGNVFSLWWSVDIRTVAQLVVTFPVSYLVTYSGYPSSIE